MIGGQPAVTSLEPVGSANEEMLQPMAVEQDHETVFHAEDDAEPAPRGAGRALAVVAVVATLAWVGGMLWWSLPSLTGLSPAALVQFIAALCVPPALIGILYLLALRTSRAEARRFGSTAQAMRAEAASLERVVAGLSQKISDNRSALAEQTTVLMALGDNAAAKLEAATDSVAQQSQRIDNSTRLLGDTMTMAERRFEILLTLLPKVHEEMQGLSGRVDQAGMLASQHAASLDAQLSALGERGREANQVAGGAAERLSAHIARMEAMSEAAGARLEKVAEQTSTAVDGVLERTANAVDEARKGIAAQGEAILAMLSANQAALDRAGRDSAAALGERMAEIEETIGRVSVRLAEEQARGDLLFVGLSAGTERVERALDATHASGMEKAGALAGSLDKVHRILVTVSDELRTGDHLARTVIATSDELLTALDASAREIDETLPQALARLDARIAATRQAIGGTQPELLALVGSAEATQHQVERIAAMVVEQRDALARAQASLIETLETGGNRAAAVGAVVEDTSAATRRFAETAAPELVEALLRVRETANAAVERSREAFATIVPEATRALEDAAGAALKRTVNDTVRREIAGLAETTEAAVAAAARASEQLGEQMKALGTATAEVERRVEAARAQQEESDSEGFTRRVSLLIESLNSASIDITKAFSADVADSAWAAYLKGDRGVFTRRASRLLDPSETREIARLYDDDDAFRDNVNRYIHDFEAMLRHILALRDGSPLGVTLLSSDMGKLYVALAQAIERLRT
ncbi:hypothetical protein LQ953_06920 [Sphingomonas sp. IC-56]|uniref:hypothetical protein n=1 Tax=Sphingomonas sp. IC-56 TaxID=2898529 RepID=UPI001E4059B4|nr:hypothetical protein [Sphingomonas sp. IC-56]MCD2323746.1 hypothetical protein [Sphingomonas sp. IC-56]